ncbi:MAG: response regulator transcription factor [Chloroflexi bacterium]|nr:MAG: response regulator transcription factor [Chloroflexota bacterium]TMG36108.1 MAG: response regulator transcription factor [Chloroflexota bacterium]
MSRIRVMIADDRPIFRAGVQGMLKDFPEIDIVAEATTGQQAVERSRQLKPDVILMDLNMPEMGGIAATRAIKAEDPDRVILALTVSEAEEDIVEMVAAGASGYVLKDVDPVTLARSILDAAAGRFLLDDTLTRRVIIRLGSSLRRKPAAPLASPLTQREAEILQMVSQGKGNKAIASRLSLSEGTVKSHLRNIYRKLRVQTRAEAAAQAARMEA